MGQSITGYVLEIACLRGELADIAYAASRALVDEDPTPALPTLERIRKIAIHAQEARRG